MSHKNKHIVTGIICATIGFGIALVVRKYRGYVFKKFRKLNGNSGVNDTQIVIVNSVEECERVAKHIQRYSTIIQTFCIFTDTIQLMADLQYMTQYMTSWLPRKGFV